MAHSSIFSQLIRHVKSIGRSGGTHSFYCLFFVAVSCTLLLSCNRQGKMKQRFSACNRVRLFNSYTEKSIIVKNRKELEVLSKHLGYFFSNSRNWVDTSTIPENFVGYVAYPDGPGEVLVFIHSDGCISAGVTRNTWRYEENTGYCEYVSGLAEKYGLLWHLPSNPNKASQDSSAVQEGTTEAKTEAEK